MLYFYTCLLRPMLESDKERQFWVNKIWYLESAAPGCPGIPALNELNSFMGKYGLDWRYLE